MAADAATVWQTLQVEHWYDGGGRDLQIASATAVWRHYGLPPVPIRWVLSLPVGRANWWLWVYHHGASAVFVAAARRSRAVMEAFLDGHWPAFRT